MATNNFERRTCLACGKASVIHIEPVTVPPTKPTHTCEACGATFVTRLNPSAWYSFAMGLLLMLAVFGLYEFSESIQGIAPEVRVIAVVVLLGGVYGFSASRVLRAIELKAWSKP